MKRHASICIATTLCILSALGRTEAQSPQQGGTLHRVPQEYPTIQAGIDAAFDGDTVLVSEGIYYENVTFRGKAVVVASTYVTSRDTSVIGSTIIDGSQPTNPDSASVIRFVSGEDTSSVLLGFTVRGGHGCLLLSGGLHGAGILCVESGARLVHNTIAGNTISTVSLLRGYGAGIRAVGSGGQRLLLEGNTITGNSIASPIGAYGGGFSSSGMHVILRENIITENSVISGGAQAEAHGGGLHITGGDVLVENNLIARNEAVAANSITIQGYGGGAFTSNVNMVFRSNTVLENLVQTHPQGSANGGGLAVRANSLNFDVIISRNLFKSNSADGGNIGRGGAVMVNDQNARIENNVMVQNRAVVGGGIGIRRDAVGNEGPVIVNNTIVLNRATFVGAAIGSFGSWRPLVLNTIARGNIGDLEIATPPGSPITVLYSNVGGLPAGTGNIDADPRFADTTYRLSDTSYCLGNGIDSVQIGSSWYRAPVTDYFGVLRPDPPGSRPDMGACENPLGTGPVPPPPDTLMGPQFRAFYDRVHNAPQPERSSIVDSFLTRNSILPFLEDTIAHFIYRGTANSVTVPSDANSFRETGSPMYKLSSTDLWFRGEAFPSEARIDYKFLVNRTDWILDPRNPRTCPSGFGPNSELAMPHYENVPEIQYYPFIAHGSITDTVLTSASLGQQRLVRVYTPPSYNPLLPEGYPVVVFHDGSEYITLALASNVLDYLIYEARITPVIAVFVPPVDRDQEYVGTRQDPYAAFIATELVPYLDSRYRTRQGPGNRATVGISNGGNIAAWIAYAYPQVFGNAASHSGNIQRRTQQAYASGAVQALKLYVDVGLYDLGGFLDLSRNIRGALQSRGYDHLYNEWPEGHSWGNWRAHLDLALEFFFPPATVNVETVEQLPVSSALMQNYPNPFNPETAIRFQITDYGFVSLRVYDLLGRQVATLVDEEKAPGSYTVKFDASNLASGTYIYRLTAGGYTATRRMVLLK